mgnify:CR=1 FL=1
MVAPHRKHSKRLADFFPEEHIVVTSGLVLFVVAVVAAAPALTSLGRSSQVAFVTTPAQGVAFSFFDAFITGMGAIAVVFLVVYLTWKYARSEMS